MTWNIEFLEEAKKDLKKLDHSVQLQVVKGIEKSEKILFPQIKEAMENLSEIKTESILQIF